MLAQTVAGRSPLAEAREAAGLRLADVAAAVGVSEGAVSRWETGERSKVPSKVFLVLGITDLAKRHAAWIRERAKVRQFTFTAGLPDGVEREQARTACKSALERLAQGATK